MNIVRTIDGKIGEIIDKFAERLISRWTHMSEISNNKNFAIKGTFNGTSLIITKDSTVESILKDFDKQLEENYQKYINSDEYKEKQKQEEIELKKLNQEVQELMNKFDSLDMKNIKEVLFWLSAIQPYTDRIGVNIDKYKIIKNLEDNGYKASENCGKDFKEDDAENFARYIIGQCLDGLNKVGAIHYMAVKFTEDWKKKFII